MTLCLIYTTLPDKTTASMLAQACVQQGLAACANILPPIESVFLWEGTCQNTTEIAMLLKTTPQRAAACMAYLSSHHPYDTPAILQLPISSADPAFTAWVQKAVNPLAES